MSDTQDSESYSASASPPQSYLFRVFDCGNPLAAPSRHSLAGLDRVTIGRDEHRVRRFADEAGKTLQLTVPDPRVSSTHAQLVKRLGRWIIEDAGSRNGVVRNGVKESTAVLVDGDLLELGQSFFIFRATMPTTPADAPDLDAGPLLLASTPGLVTLLPKLAADFQRLADIARSTVSVVINGPTGTGKELIARAVHSLSGRPGPFVAVNCGALPDTLVETELFGYRKGAFSGANEDRPGLVRSSDRGTLLLDEIGDLPLSSQAAFLRVLQERQVVPIGGTKPVGVDLRLCAATHHSLDELVSDGDFRADLLARISGYTVTLPALAQRREDLGLLIATLLRRQAMDRAVTFTKEVGRAMLQYAWPLNIRELEKVLESSTVVAAGAPIALEHLPPAFGQPAVRPAAERGGSVRDTAPVKALSSEDQQRRSELVALLAEHGGNISAIARVMGKERVQIRRWLSRFQIDPDDYKSRRA